MIFILFSRYILRYKYQLHLQNQKMESGLMMLLHSLIIGIVLYLLMKYILKQNQAVAENRSIVIAAVILIYMILFGHGLPNSVNKNL